MEACVGVGSQKPSLLCEEEQIKRSVLRDPSSKEEIIRIISSQIPRKERLKHADDIIDNTKSDLSIIKESVMKLDQKYQILATKS